MDTGQWLAILLSAVLGVWFAVGSIINRRRGVEVFRWLKTGLETFGKVTEARWIGSSGSGARLVVGEPHKPFRRVEVVFLLDSREIMPLWLFNLLRGKKDEMILKANLRRPPTQMTEANRRRGPAAESPAESTRFQVEFGGQADDALRARVFAFLDRYPDAIRKLSIQRTEPHLIVRVDLPPLRSEPSERFFTELLSRLEGSARISDI